MAGIDLAGIFGTNTPFFHSKFPLTLEDEVLASFDLRSF